MFFEDIEPLTSDRLAEAISQSYKVFAKYRKSGTIDHCDCSLCMTNEDAKLLSTLPLEDISSELLAKYTNSAHGENEFQFKHFLPRYFDLIAQCDPPTDMSCIDVCLARLGSARYRKKWPSAEVQIIDEFFDAFMETCLYQLLLVKWHSGWKLEFDIGEVLSMVVLAGGDIERVLDVFERGADPEAAVHMASLRKEVKYRKGIPQYNNEFLKESPAAAKRIGEWAMRDEVTERIKAASKLLDDPNYDDVISGGL